MKGLQVVFAVALILALAATSVNARRRRRRPVVSSNPTKYTESKFKDTDRITVTDHDRRDAVYKPHPAFFECSPIDGYIEVQESKSTRLETDSAKYDGRCVRYCDAHMLDNKGSHQGCYFYAEVSGKCKGYQLSGTRTGPVTRPCIYEYDYVEEAMAWTPKSVTYGELIPLRPTQKQSTRDGCRRGCDFYRTLGCKVWHWDSSNQDCNIFKLPDHTTAVSQGDSTMCRCQKKTRAVFPYSSIHKIPIDN